MVVTEEQLNAKLDEILVKIAREGRASLTDDELDRDFEFPSGESRFRWRFVRTRKGFS